MTRSQLNRAVARATGDDPAVVTYRGFNLVEDRSPLFDEDLDALIADWEQIEAEELISPSRDRSTDNSFAQKVARRTRIRMLKSAKIAQKANRHRRATDAAH